MRNAQAVTIAYDGLKSQAPDVLYLKPYYNDVNKSYFRKLPKENSNATDSR